MLEKTSIMLYMGSSATKNPMMNQTTGPWAFDLEKILSLRTGISLEIPKINIFDVFYYRDIKTANVLASNTHYSLRNSECLRNMRKFARNLLLQMECWGRSMWVYLVCAQINPERTPTPSTVIDVLNCESNPFVLKYSRQYSIVMQDRIYAQRIMGRANRRRPRHRPSSLSSQKNFPHSDGPVQGISKVEEMPEV